MTFYIFLYVCMYCVCICASQRQISVVLGTVDNTFFSISISNYELFGKVCS